MALTDKEQEDAAELLHSAFINMTENVCERIPQLAAHPLYKVAKMQFAEGLKLLGRDVSP
jgi:hypothetical protein